MKKVQLFLIVTFMYIPCSLATEIQDSAYSPPYEVYNLGEIYVTAERVSAIEDITVTSTLTEEEIKATNSETVAEALSYVPGMRVSTGTKNEPNIQIHGIDQSKIIVLIDGVPYYETNYGKLDLNQIPVDNIAKIEITKGVSSVLYGPNGIGGVVNIITKKPSDKPFIETIVEVGDNATSKVSLSHGMKKGVFNYWLNYTHHESNGWRMSDDYDPHKGEIVRKPGGTEQAILENGGFRDNSDFKSDSFWAKAGVELDSDSEYYVNFHYLSREKGNPPSTEEVQVFTDRPAFSRFSRITRYDDWGIDLSGQQKVLEPITMKGKLFYHNHVDDYTSFADQDYFEEIAVSRFKDYLVGGSLITEIEPVQSDIVRLSFNYRGDSHKERDDTYLPFAESFSNTGSVGFENEFSGVENLSLIFGGSYDWFRVTKAERNLTDRNTGDLITQESLEKPDTMNEINPMIGASYSFTDSTRIFASVAEKVRFPTLQQLYSSKSGNINLTAEKSINYVTGISHAFHDLAHADLSFFYYNISDFITRDAPGHLGGRYQNFGKINIYGFELNSTVFLFDDLTVNAGYTYEYARDKSRGRVTDDVTNIPEHKVDLSMKYRVPFIKAMLDLTNTYMSDVYSQLPTPQRPTEPKIKTGDYFVSNIRLSKIFFEKYEAYLAVNNMFDSDYESEAGFPGPGRNFYVGLALRI